MNKNIISISAIFGALVVAFAVAAAGSVGGIEIFGLPLFFCCGLVAFLIQWVAFIPAYIFQTEKYFDLFGSLTYIALAFVTLFLSLMEPGSIAVALMVLIWAGRLGYFLFNRVRRIGHDSRFRTIKPDFLQFLMTWTLQGLWVFLTFSAGLAAITSGREHPVDEFVVTGGFIWLVGFVIEVVADKQKSDFRMVESNSNEFITHGLWAWSRHPNYFGEILLWTGIAIAALPVLAGWQHLTLVSPFFVFLLLTRISGVRMLELRAARRWGTNPDYIEYCRTTKVLLLFPPLAKAKS